MASDPKTRKSRTMKPREPVAMTVALVSQHTSLAVIGLPPRHYLERLAAHPEIPRTRLGKLLLSDPRDWQRLLAPIDPSADGARDALDDDDQPADVDAVLSMLGRRRTA